jgi:type VII secretion-associated serine protease mycosin
LIRPARALVALLAAAAVLLPGAPAGADATRDLQWHLRFLKVTDAHRLSQGAGVTVAVIDTGVDARHPDLTRNVLTGMDFYNPGDGRRDEDGHGTEMAALIAAHGRGGSGVLGVAPQAKILPVRVGASEFAFLDRHAQGIRWAVERGAKVICVAIGGGDSAELRAAIQAAIAADVVVVAGAGNLPRARRVEFPAATPGVVAAAGVDQAGNHASVSVTGPELVLAAPAVKVVSADIDAGYSEGEGTSASTAIIAGVAALVRARYPNLSAPEVIHRMTATAIDKGPAGRDSEYGFGLVDPVGALTKDVPPLAASSSPAGARTTGAGTAAPRADQEGNRGPLLAMILVGGLVLVAIVVGAVVMAVRRGSG